jgi:putative transposase
MARMAHLILPGMAFHVVQHGNHRDTVFVTDKDRQVFLKILHEYRERYQLRILGYCLMSEDPMALTLGRANAEYSSRIHIQRRQVGQLWQGRYRSCLLNECHLWNALCYAEQNPVRAGMTSCAWEWRCRVRPHASSGTIRRPGRRCLNLD